MARFIRLMWSAIMATVVLSMAGCAGVQPAAQTAPRELFADALFKPPAQPASTANLFALNPAMRAYLHSARFGALLRTHGQERGLVEALYRSGELQLDYDASVTRNAADTYDLRTGNCLSLVLMTAAFAKELGMPVQYNDVVAEQIWSRSGDMYFANTHVNLTLGRPFTTGFRTAESARALTVDFLPSEDGAALRSRPIDEATIVAMYMNNRAAELMAERKLDDAYWWARNLLEQHPDHSNGYNTLGVVYQRHGNLLMAERVFKAGLAREPENLHLMNNLIPVLAGLGKHDEAQGLKVKLASIDPTPPFHYFHKGQGAMARGDFKEAKKMFAKEVRRSPFYHEFHFWLAMAQLGLGDRGAAREQLNLAVETSNTKELTRRYSAKLEHLRASAARRPFAMN